MSVRSRRNGEDAVLKRTLTLILLLSLVKYLHLYFIFEFKYNISVPYDLSVKAKAALVGATFLIVGLSFYFLKNILFQDFMYFERISNNNN